MNVHNVGTGRAVLRGEWHALCAWRWMVALVALGVGLTGLAAPKTSRKPIFNEYHGVRVADDYQWLEADDDPSVARWTAAQNRQARAFLDKLPARSRVEDRLTRLLHESSTNYFSPAWRRGTVFCSNRNQPRDSRF